MKRFILSLALVLCASLSHAASHPVPFGFELLIGPGNYGKAIDYIERYRDVNAACGGYYVCALNHWQQYGQYESRTMLPYDPIVKDAFLSLRAPGMTNSFRCDKPTGCRLTQIDLTIDMRSQSWTVLAEPIISVTGADRYEQGAITFPRTIWSSTMRQALPLTRTQAFPNPVTIPYGSHIWLWVDGWADGFYQTGIEVQGAWWIE